MEKLFRECAICGCSIEIDEETISSVTLKMLMSLDEIQNMDACICGKCSLSGVYKEKYFLSKIPHIVFTR